VNLTALLVLVAPDPDPDPEPEPSGGGGRQQLQQVQASTSTNVLNDSKNATKAIRTGTRTRIIIIPCRSERGLLAEINL
jgi:hypothetical protein